MAPPAAASASGLVQRGSDPLRSFGVLGLGGESAEEACLASEDLKESLVWLSGAPIHKPAGLPLAKDISIASPVVQGAAVPGEPLRATFDAARGLPGDRRATISAKPGEVLEAVKSFFRDEVPAVVKQHEGLWELSATAFLDYAAVHLTALVQRGPAEEAEATLIFRSASRRDDVLFDRLWKAALEYFDEMELPVALPGGGAPLGGGPGLLDCGFDDFEAWDDSEGSFDDMASIDEPAEDWACRVDSALDAAASPAAADQEEGLQALAAWAARCPDSRQATAKALAARPELVARLLAEGVERLYPFSVVLEFATARSGKLLAGFAELIRAALRSGHPGIVESSLLAAADNLAAHAPRVGGRTSFKELRTEGLAACADDLEGVEEPADGLDGIEEPDFAILSCDDLPVQRTMSWSAGPLVEPTPQGCQARRPAACSGLRVKTIEALPSLNEEKAPQANEARQPSECPIHRVKTTGALPSLF